MEQDLLELTQEQKDKALQMSKEGMALPQITKMIFANESLDGRSIEGKSLKHFLQDAGEDVKTSKFIKVREDITLTDEQKKFIEDNLDSVKSAIEMTRLIFKIPSDQKIQPLSKEFKAVYSCIQSLNPDADRNNDVVEERNYKAPINIQNIITRVNNYVKISMGKKAYDWNSLTKEQKKNLESLVNYMNTERFIYQATQYIKTIDRTLFESNFIRYTHDKPDLTQEEVDQYIGLSEEIVACASASRRKIRLESEVDNVLDGEEGKRLSQVMAELIADAKKEIDDSKSRQEKLFKALTGTRNDRLKGRMDRNATVINLLEAWEKEEKRNQLIEIGIKEHKADEKEIERLSTMDDVICLIAGLTKAEASK